jgi:hypothetical protein
MIRSLIDAATRPMTKDESGIFMAAMLNPKLKEEFDEAFSEELGFPGKVLYRRLSVFSTAKISKGLALLTVVMSNGSPGNLVMWTYTFHRMNKGEMISISDFTDVFPFGVPSEEGLSDIWDSQKHNGNLIDDVANWN